MKKRLKGRKRECASINFKIGINQLKYELNLFSFFAINKLINSAKV